MFRKESACECVRLCLCVCVGGSLFTHPFGGWEPAQKGMFFYVLFVLSSSVGDFLCGTPCA